MLVLKLSKRPTYKEKKSGSFAHNANAYPSQLISNPLLLVGQPVGRLVRLPRRSGPVLQLAIGTTKVSEPSLDLLNCKQK